MRAIVVSVRGLQAGALGCYGNAWIDTPAFDALAAGGIVFDWHYAARADAEGAGRAWRTGRYDLPTDVAAGAVENEPDLLDALRKKEIHTRLIFDANRPCPNEFTKGWDAVERVSTGENETPLDAVLEAVGTALERLEHRDAWLLWIDLPTLLPPWNVPQAFQEPYFIEESEEEGGGDEEEEPETEPLTPFTGVPNGLIDREDDFLYLSLQTSYAAAVSYVDAALGQLLEAVNGLDGGDEILLAVTADIGQNLGEHGLVGNSRPWLHDELIHLPMLLRLPGGAEGGRRVEALTQDVDLAPTLADWFGVELPGVHGRSLLRLARGLAETIRPYVCSGLQIGAALEFALRTPQWAFLLPAHPHEEDKGRSPQLYVKPDDRWEVNNVAQHHWEYVEQLERTLRDFVAATSQPGPLQVPPFPEVESTAPDPE